MVQDLGGGTALVSISASITGLIPDTTYYVQPVAENSAIITYGPVASFMTGGSNTLSNPPADHWAVPAYTFTPVNDHQYRVGQTLPACWRWGRNGTFVARASAPHCLAHEVAATNRAQREERLPAIVLPRNFAALSAPEQSLVLVDIERVSRGETPVLGVSASVNVFAQLGARANADPSLPGDSGVAGATYAWAANYAGAVSPLDANYEWMYTDGWDGKLTFNYDCTGPHAQGCWGHRDNILADANWMPCNESSCSIVMGAGYVRNGAGDGFSSYTELFVQVSGVMPTLYYTWNQAVAAGAKA
ncbi:MAG TPA: hypothetical protein VND89_01900 [Acidimicrobiales bacterium]|nr:hypothetical protein [Acidimicrobiales bacterium]